MIERFAPEHLSLMVADPYAWVPKIRRAGAIFVGDDTPVAAGDYLAGTNHTLPTSGAGRFSSGLRTADYLRTMTLVENSPRADGRRRRAAGRAGRLRGPAGARAHGPDAHLLIHQEMPRRACKRARCTCFPPPLVWPPPSRCSPA